jgi:hypothetical protein
LIRGQSEWKEEMGAKEEQKMSGLPIYFLCSTDYFQTPIAHLLERGMRSEISLLSLFSFPNTLMTNPNYLDKLNDYQKEAVVSDAKYLQILAGPGSGKTRGNVQLNCVVYAHHFLFRYSSHHPSSMDGQGKQCGPFITSCRDFYQQGGQ